MYLADYHTHSDCSPDGRETIARMAEAAVARGLDEICIILVAACYSEDDCFYWGKELENFAAWQHMCNEYKPGSSALLHALEVYELPKNKTK